MPSVSSCPKHNRERRQADLCGGVTQEALLLRAVCTQDRRRQGKLEAHRGWESSTSCENRLTALLLAGKLSGLPPIQAKAL